MRLLYNLFNLNNCKQANFIFLWKIPPASSKERHQTRFPCHSAQKIRKNTSFTTNWLAQIVEFNLYFSALRLTPNFFQQGRSSNSSSFSRFCSTCLSFRLHQFTFFERMKQNFLLVVEITTIISHQYFHQLLNICVS